MRRLQTNRIHSSSDLPIEEYHKLSDEALDSLLDTLEGLFYTKERDNHGWEIDYNVRLSSVHQRFLVRLLPPVLTIYPFYAVI